MRFTGVVEGFYGKPWGRRCRDTIVSMLSSLPSPGYLYAPKNDPWHRLLWREPYPDAEWDALTVTMDLCRRIGVTFFFGVSPWAFQDGEAGLLRTRLIRALDSGAGGVAVLFDDVPQLADACLASRQLDLAYEAIADLDVPVLVCPSVYCMELLESLCGNGYLEAWREQVPEGWSSIWTGDLVVSPDMSSEAVRRGADLLGSSPVIWDNLVADDYSLRRIFLAEMDGRTGVGAGYLLNPSEIEPVAVHSVHQLLRAEGQDPDWPAGLGDRKAWELLRMFHYLPWSDGGAGGLMNELEQALRSGAEPGLLEELDRMSNTLSTFAESLYGVEGGFGLMPYVVDVRKFLVWWSTALHLPDRNSRVKELDRLMRRRLPWEHPLAAFTLGALYREHPVEGSVR